MIYSLKYSSIDYIKKNYKDIFKEIKTNNDSLDDNLTKIIGLNYKEITKFVNPRISFDMSDYKDPKSTDFNNSRLIYEAFINLTESQASDFRLWSGYAINNDVYNYLKYRWKDDERTIYYRVSAHAGGKRGLAYHGIARLWWFAHLTYDETKDNPYELTEFTFEYPHIMEKMIYRNFSNSKSIRFGIIKGIKKFLDQGGKYHTKKLDELYKHISLLSGVNLLDVIPEDEIIKISVHFLLSLGEV